MYLIVGLGNPGKKYNMTRHNVGFMAMDLISHKLNINVEKLKFQGLIGETKVNNEKVVLLKPQTFMNSSGNSVYEAVNFYKISPQNVIVIYDDMDLPVGSVRIRKQGSSGGHNGIKSIIYQLQTEQFIRIRIGIGKPENKDEKKVIDHVLTEFYKSEQEDIFKALEITRDAVIEIINENIDSAMNKYNTKA